MYSQEVLREKRKLSAAKSPIDVHIRLDGELSEDIWYNSTKFENISWIIGQLKNIFARRFITNNADEIIKFSRYKAII